MTYAAVAAWLVLCALLSWYWWIDYSMYGDFDDAVKMALLRNNLATGDLTSRLLPNVLQPEQFETHWTWIADAPYILVAWILQPFAGLEHALQIAAFFVPLALLLGLMLVIARISVALGYDSPVVVFLAALTIPYNEFQPDRIDYHNIQMLLLVAMAYCVMSNGWRTALIFGVLSALSFSISPELSFFVALGMAVFVVRFVLNKPGSANELAGLGLGLLVASLILWVAVNPQLLWRATACDTYGTPHFAALAGATTTFLVTPYLAARSGAMVRVASILIGAALTSAVLVLLFPACIGGPYSALDPYVYEQLIDTTMQEKSVLSRPEGDAFGWIFAVVLEVAPTLIVVGALICGALKNRAWIVYALFCALIVAVALCYIRYMRFVGLFEWPGLLILAACLGRFVPALGKYIPTSRTLDAPKIQYLLAPALIVAGGLFLLVGAPYASSRTPTGAQVAAACDGRIPPALKWAEGSKIMAPPGVDMRLFKQAGATLVSIPFHRSATGLERTFRVLDPATPNPKTWFEQSGATHLVVCSSVGEMAEGIKRDYPFVASLMLGKAPDWLTECSLPQPAVVRIYRPTEAPLSACPLPAN